MDIKQIGLVNEVIGARFALVVGHAFDKQGARDVYGNTEFAMWSEFAKRFYDIYDVYHHDSYSRGYSSMCKRTGKRINKSINDYDLVISLHFNASSNPRVHGVVTLWNYKFPQVNRFLGYFKKHVKNCLGSKYLYDREVHNKYDRGFGEIDASYYPHVIIESFFGTNKPETSRVWRNLIDLEYSFRVSLEEYAHFLDKSMDDNG